MIRKGALAMALILLMTLGAAHAEEQLTLPEDLLVIGEEAFAGNAAIREVIIASGTQSVEARAFAGCEGLGWLTIPGTVKSLGEDFVSGCAEDLLIRTEPDSAACAYAQLHQLDYQACTAYRALLIGQTYPSQPSLKLQGPQNDVTALNTCLSLFGDTPYQVTVSMNLTADDILQAISSCFGSASESDVSLLYYSGHGVWSESAALQGALLGADGTSYITATQLRTALDKIPGRKIVVIDACYSGNMLTAKTTGSSAAATAEDFAASFISVFSAKPRSNLASEGYFVLTAAASNEASYESTVGSRVMGLFTSSLVTGCGYNSVSFSPDDLLADVNGNSVLTLQEVYQYTYNALLAHDQHVQVYPTDCSWFGMLRK